MDTSQPLAGSSFDKKVRIFSHDYLKCCLYISGTVDPKKTFTKRLYSKFISTSMLLEDFLDYHGAKNNKDWYFFRELSASVRHLSLGCYSQKHILNRLIFYDLDDQENFKREGETTFKFLTQCLKRLAPVIIEEAVRLDIPVPVDRIDIASFPGVITGEMLEYTIDDENKDLQK